MYKTKAFTRRLTGQLTCIAAALTIPVSPSAAQAVIELPAITVIGEATHDDPGGYTRKTSRTATRSDTPTLEVPFSVQTVTPRMIEERRPGDLARALETVPGVSVGYGGGFSNSGRARIRGFPNVSNFKDGFRIGAVAGELDLANISAIEVLKGPASAIYGRFEPGGIINLITKDPVASPLLETSVTGGSYGFARATVDAGGALNASQTITSRINAAFERSDGFRDFTHYDKYFLAPALGFQLSDSTHLTLKGEFLKNDAPFDRALPNHPVSLTVPMSRNFGEPWMRSAKEQWLGSAALVHEFNADWRARLAVQGARTNVKEAYHNYGFPPVSGDTITRTFINAKERHIDRTVQAELYGRTTTGPIAHKLLFGAEYNDEEWAFERRRRPGSPVSVTNPVASPRPADDTYLPASIGSSSSDGFGLYVQDEMALGSLRILAGGRLDRVRGEVGDAIGGPTPPQVRQLTTFAPRLGLTYLITPELSVYGSWARSTRMPLDQGLLANNALPKPTTGEQYEVGLKGDFLDGRLQPTLSLFDLTKTNALVPDPANFEYSIQTGELRVRGVEIEVAAQPTPAWQVLASFTYQDAYISEDTDPGMIGKQFQGVPKYQASLWTSYNFGTDTEGLTVGGGVFFASRRPTMNDNRLFLPSFTRVDLFAAYRFNESTELQLNLHNVTNERNYLVGGFGMITPQPPFEAQLTLSHSFN